MGLGPGIRVEVQGFSIGFQGSAFQVRHSKLEAFHAWQLLGFLPFADAGSACRADSDLSHVGHLCAPGKTTQVQRARLSVIRNQHTTVLLRPWSCYLDSRLAASVQKICLTVEVIHPDVLEPTTSPGDDANAEEEMKLAMKIADRAAVLLSCASVVTSSLCLFLPLSLVLSFFVSFSLSLSRSLSLSLSLSLALSLSLSLSLSFSLSLSLTSLSLSRSVGPGRSLKQTE